MKTIIHVNQHNIKKNIKLKQDIPCITVKTYKSNNYGHEALIKDKKGNIVAKVISNMDNPLSCGARCWIETHLDVEIINRNT